MFIEIKHPFAYLRKDNSSCLFTKELSEVMNEKDKVASIDNLPDNYPQFVISIHSIKDAYERIRDMVEKEGWELVESSERFLSPLIED